MVTTACAIHGSSEQSSAPQSRRNNRRQARREPPPRRARCAARPRNWRLQGARARRAASSSSTASRERSSWSAAYSANWSACSSARSARRLIAASNAAERRAQAQARRRETFARQRGAGATGRRRGGRGVRRGLFVRGRGQRTAFGLRRGQGAGADNSTIYHCHGARQGLGPEGHRKRSLSGRRALYGAANRRRRRKFPALAPS